MRILSKRDVNFFLLVVTSLYHEHTACHIRNMSTPGFWLLFGFSFPLQCQLIWSKCFISRFALTWKQLKSFKTGKKEKKTFCTNLDIKIKLKYFYVACHIEQKTLFDVPLIWKPSKNSITALYPFTYSLFFCPFLLSFLLIYLPPASFFVPGTFCFSYELTSLMWPCVSFPSRLAAVLATEEKNPHNKSNKSPFCEEELKTAGLKEDCIWDALFWLSTRLKSETHYHNLKQPTANTRQMVGNNPCIVNK